MFRDAFETTAGHTWPEPRWAVSSPNTINLERGRTPSAAPARLPSGSDPGDGPAPGRSLASRPGRLGRVPRRCDLRDLGEGARRRPRISADQPPGRAAADEVPD